MMFVAALLAAYGAALSILVVFTKSVPRLVLEASADWVTDQHRSCRWR